MAAPSDLPKLGKDAMNWAIQKGWDTVSVGLGMHYFEIQKAWQTCGSDYMCKLEKLMLYFTAIFGGTSPAIAISELAEKYVNKAWGWVQTGDQPLMGKDSWGPVAINMMIYVYIEHLLTQLCDWVRYSTECLKQNVCENDNILVWIYNMKARHCNKTETDVDIDVEVDCLEGECLDKDVAVPDVVYKITDNSDWCVIFFNEFPLLMMALLIWSAYIVSDQFKNDKDKVKAAKRAEVTGTADSDKSGTDSGDKKTGKGKRKKGSGKGKGDSDDDGRSDNDKQDGDSTDKGTDDDKQDGDSTDKGTDDDKQDGDSTDKGTDDDKQDGESDKGSDSDKKDTDSSKEKGGTDKKKRAYNKKKKSTDTKKAGDSSSVAKSGRTKGVESSGAGAGSTQKVEVKCPTCGKIRDMCMPNPLPVFCDKCGPKMAAKVKSTRSTDDDGFKKCRRKPKPKAKRKPESPDEPQNEDVLIKNQHFMANNSTEGHLTLAVAVMEKMTDDDESDDHDEDSSEDYDDELLYKNYANLAIENKNELGSKLMSRCPFCKSYHVNHDHVEDSVDEDVKEDNHTDDEDKTNNNDDEDEYDLLFV